MPAKRKVNYPPARTATRQPRPTGDPSVLRRGPVTIEVDAAKGRGDLKVGDRVRIAGTGMYSGEIAVIEKISNGVIQSATVRTMAGRTRQARTVDLVPVGAGEGGHNAGAAAEG
ncbi:MAG: hypothetical protein U0869_12065 [Chloroflexota bacterium]